ncbi:MAG: tRNA pseudouridine(55) synthase TruB [candidate division WOR-3 bacterium]|nr:tRNA pseudouridine(55) synthase TruB [candidate division WOR-3 bacterium]
MMELNRIIPVYKPVGPSTFDLVRLFKKNTLFKGKIGHGGTLDPFACGVVLLLLGDATKKFEEIKTWEKVYTGGIILGAESDTGDITGRIRVLDSGKLVIPNLNAVKEALEKFKGVIEQEVPSYSAAKFQGMPLYKLARKGISITKHKQVEIYNIELIHYKYPTMTIRVICKGGVYIRQLARDIAHVLRTEGFLYYLQRERIGEFTIKDCIEIQNFAKITIQ